MTISQLFWINDADFKKVDDEEDLTQRRFFFGDRDDVRTRLRDLAFRCCFIRIDATVLAAVSIFSLLLSLHMIAYLSSSTKGLPIMSASPNFFTSNISSTRSTAASSPSSTPPRFRRYRGWEGDEILPAFALSELEWTYQAGMKGSAFVGNKFYMDTLPRYSRGWYNSLAVVKGFDVSDHMHGVLGIREEDGQPLWEPKPSPPPIDKVEPKVSHFFVNMARSKFPGGKEKALENGGFYLALSDALPLDRATPDTREQVCKETYYDLAKLGDASIVITFFNEPLSTLLRSVYSILNKTPSPLLREIVLVDDHSTTDELVPGGRIYDYVEYLPKVKLMRMPQRRGIVHARIAGAKAAQGAVLVIMDSHIEVNSGWLEPQLARIAESPKSVVFPQILSINSEDFSILGSSGIGCFLTFRWVIVEQASLTGNVTKPNVLPSPSMAGGLFAVDKDWFWELGGYDEGFVAWGAENVEMAFRVWMCGGRVECAPCSRTYHIYRKGGSGYSNPTGALWRNRRRTARVWMDEYYQIAERLIDVSAAHYPNDNVGSIDNMLRLKKALKCKPFSWYLKNVDPKHDIQTLDDVIALGRVKKADQCLDTGGSKTVGTILFPFPCHPKANVSASQGFLVSRGDNRLRLLANDKRCIGVAQQSNATTLSLQPCNDSTKSRVWKVVLVGTDQEQTTAWVQLIFQRKSAQSERCLSMSDKAFLLRECDSSTVWELDMFVPDPEFELPQVQRQYNLRRIDSY